jgi:hypothetical protein
VSFRAKPLHDWSSMHGELSCRSAQTDIHMTTALIRNSIVRLRLTVAEYHACVPIGRRHCLYCQVAEADLTS